MKKQNPKHISEFKQGDLITRIAPTQVYQKQMNDTLGIEMDVPAYQDNSGIGEKYKFLGIANGTIYLENAEGMFKGKKVDYFKMYSHGNGWVKYVEPESIWNKKEKFLDRKNIENVFDDLDLN